MPTTTKEKTTTVTPASVRKTIGSTVEFRCEGGSSPRTRIQWVKRGGNLPDQHQTLNGVLV